MSAVPAGSISETTVSSFAPAAPEAATQAGLTIDRRKIIANGNVGLFVAVPSPP